MTSERTRPNLTSLAETIRQDLTAADLGLTEAAFERLSANLAQAILDAIDAHVADCHRPEPEFGELERRG